MAKFLDENGVKKLWSRIQEYIYECGCNNCSGGGGFTVIHADTERDGDCTVYTLDKTGAEILEILKKGGNIAIDTSIIPTSQSLYFPTRIYVKAPKNSSEVIQSKAVAPSLKATLPAIVIVIIMDGSDGVKAWDFYAQDLSQYPSYTYCSGK